MDVIDSNMEQIFPSPFVTLLVVLIHQLLSTFVAAKFPI